MPTDALTTLLSATGGAFLGKFVGPAAEGLGKAAWERAQQLGARATALLAQAGREPQHVEPKILLPLVQAASLEPDPTLTDLWAALLANAADSTQRSQVQPGFTEILRQLAAADIHILQALYYNQGYAQQPVSNRLLRHQLATLLSLTTEEIELACENLQRLGLCADAILKEVDVAAGGLAGGVVATTLFGLAFMRAVTPPAP